jgi:hypothetical protein
VEPVEVRHAVVAAHHRLAVYGDRRNPQPADRLDNPGEPGRAVAAGGLIMRRGKPLTEKARLYGRAAIQARADAFARSMAGTIADLEREGITSSYAMAKALNERGMATARSGRWDAHKVIDLRRRQKRLGL